MGIDSPLCLFLIRYVIFLVDTFYRFLFILSIVFLIKKLIISLKNITYIIMNWFAILKSKISTLYRYDIVYHFFTNLWQFFLCFLVELVLLLFCELGLLFLLIVCGCVLCLCSKFGLLELFELLECLWDELLLVLCDFVGLVAFVGRWFSVVGCKICWREYIILNESVYRL